MSAWDTFGMPSRNPRGAEWLAIGDKRDLRMHGCAQPVPVTLISDVKGDYRGWVSHNASDMKKSPTMVQHKKIFNVQFPSGAEAAEQAGRGRVVLLRIERREA